MVPMSMHAIFPDRVITPQREIRDAAVIVEGGRIAAAGPRNEVTVPTGAKHVDARGITLIPGFVDVHIHGAGGRDVMEATPEALSVVAKTVARHGTTSFVATTVTASADDICRSCEGIAKYIATQH